MGGQSLPGSAGKSKRVDALWEAIFKATRIDQEDPIQAWREHTKVAGQQGESLK